MCRNPHLIVNNTKSYKRGFDKVMFEVPCNHCPECIIKLQDEWFLRCAAEYDLYTRAGGKVMFSTFTHNDKHLPWYVDDEAGIKIKCFSVKDRQNWLKRLRNHWEKDFGYRDDNLDEDGKPILPVKCIIFAEFGERYDRPHYHPVIFLPPHRDTCFHLHKRKQVDNYVNGKKVALHKSKKDYVALVENSWRFNTIKRAKYKTYFENGKKYKKEVQPAVVDEIGYVFWSKECKGGPFIKNMRALRYASKYASKCAFFMNQPDVIKYEQYLKGLKVSDPDKYAEKIVAWRQCLPRHLQGINFGVSLCDQLKGDSYLDTLKNGLRYFENGKVSFHSVPRYIYNKVAYEYGKTDNKVDPSKRFLTDLGQKMAFYKLDCSIKNRTSDLDVRNSFLWLSSHVQNFDALYNKFPQISGKTIPQILDYIRCSMNGATVRDLAVYDVLLRNYSFRVGSIPSYDNLLDSAMSFAVKRIDRQLEPLVRYVDSLGVEKDPLLKNTAVYLKERDHLFNKLKYFSDFDFVLDFFDFVSAEFKNSEKTGILLRQYESSLLRSFIYSS